MAGLTNCPQCGAPVDAGLRQCKYCNAVLVQQAQPQQPAPPRYTPQPTTMPVRQMPPPPPAPPKPRIPRKSKVAAGLLAIFLGVLGVHKFYLGKWVQGILYLALCWTYVPALVGLIEGIVYLCSSDESFAAKYGGYY